MDNFGPDTLHYKSYYMLACYTDYSAVEVIISTENTSCHSSKELKLPDPFPAAWSCKSS